MTGVRILRLYHSAVVQEYRERERQLHIRHGWDVHVVTPPAWPEGGAVVEATPGGDGHVHIVPTRGRTHPIFFRYEQSSLRDVIRRVRPQLVDLHEEPYSLAAWGALRAVEREAPGVPVCFYTAQNVHKRYPPPFRGRERRVLSRSAAAYPCSNDAADVIRRKGFRGSIHVIPLGVRSTAPPRATNGHARVGFVGRLVPEKGVDLALHALARSGGDATFEIVGGGPEETQLRSLAAALGLGDRVLFTGAVSQERALERIAAFDVLVVPSRSSARRKEQFGRVAAQALAAGTPVLAADSGSLAEVLDGCGELFREGDAADLADRLKRLLADPERRRKLAAAGRRRAESDLSWEHVADRMDAMYREVLDRG